MLQQKISLARIFLLLAIIVSIGVVLGFLPAIGKIGKNNLPVVVNPDGKKIGITTDKTEYGRGEDIVWHPQNYKLGDLFLLRESCNDDFTTGPKLEEYINDGWENANWHNPPQRFCEMTHYDCTRLKTDFNNIIKTKYVDFENKETILNFGTYRIKMSFGKSCVQSGEKMDELKDIFTVYSNEFTIKEKSATDPRCSQRVRITGICEGKLIDDIGYQFNSEIGKCIEKAVGGSGCRVETPFSSLEECQKTCENLQVDFYSCEKDSDCISVKAGCCGCNAGGNAKAINKNFKMDWKGECEEIAEVMCPAVMSDDPSCFKKPTCVSNKCVLE